MTPSAVRFREDTGWEFRCESCTKRGKARFWPLTDEFWERSRGMLRCRACWQSHDRERMRAHYRSMPEIHRERRRAQQRAYRRSHPGQQRAIEAIKWERIKADPERLERERARGRESQRRYRERRAA